jgi:hypothetical protein
VTRAYQVLKRLGLLRRTDPGRDANNPFEQATYITEVLLPPGALSELQASPNRPSQRSRPAACDAMTAPAVPPPSPIPPNPHEHLSLKERLARLKFLPTQLSPTELQRWNTAICGTARHLEFDPDTQVPADLQTEIQQYLATRKTAHKPTQILQAAPAADAARPRRLSVFDVARLRHGLQKLATVQDTDELTRQVLWSIEAGNLRSFGIAHAINIALKKIREGQWTRPHRMPPNWMRKLSEPARPETCSGA